MATHRADEQAAFETWLDRERPSGDVEEVDRQWLKSRAYHDFCDELNADSPPAALPAPIDMVLHCPACRLQHIDAPEPSQLMHIDKNEACETWWSNPPHRSHLCHGCGHIWRPADVPTSGVVAVKTAGKADSPIIRKIRIRIINGKTP